VVEDLSPIHNATETVDIVKKVGWRALYEEAPAAAASLAATAAASWVLAAVVSETARLRRLAVPTQPRALLPAASCRPRETSPRRVFLGMSPAKPSTVKFTHECGS